mmetsp:Transcript_3011/g.4111  ORF Transcript_3011/g.4111 Transcript_3011/m.4111 type:complete len:85 (+) Transcript_3011:1-255(+)
MSCKNEQKLGASSQSSRDRSTLRHASMLQARIMGRSILVQKQVQVDRELLIPTSATSMLELERKIEWNRMEHDENYISKTFHDV